MHRLVARLDGRRTDGASARTFRPARAARWLNRIKAAGALSVWLQAAVLPATAAPAHTAASATVRIRFLDSATGRALQPELVELQPRATGRAPLRLTRQSISHSGRIELSLERGRHRLTAVAPTHKPIWGEFDPEALGPMRLDFYLDPIVEPEEIRPEHVRTLLKDGFTLIQGYVVDDLSGELLSGVQVRSEPSGAQTETDQHGFFRFYVPVQSAKEWAEMPANLRFEKPGYGPLERRHIELWSRGDWTYRIRLQPGNTPQVVDERTGRRNLSASSGATTPAFPGGPAGASSPSAPDASEPMRIEPMAGEPVPMGTSPSNATVRVPRNIRVQRVSLGTIDYVTMNYYVRSVLPSEWIASWGSYTGGSNSLNAGAIAARCYAIARLNSVSSSSTYDICDTSSCQVYNPSKIHSLTDLAVNYTENYVLVNSSGTIPSTEYSAENNSLGYPCGDGYTSPTGGCLYDPICTGEERFGHGRGMCQWGSARWATARRMAGRNSADGTPTGYPRQDWKWIVLHYYPDYVLVRGAPLLVGDDVKVVGSSQTVRMCADGGIASGMGCPAVTTKAVGDTGVIVDGPVQVTADGYGFTWYKVLWSDSQQGWVRENWLERALALPAAPSGLVATGTATNRIELSWSDNSIEEFGFKIERATSSSGPWTEIEMLGPNATAWADTNGLSPGTTWFYRVRAFNSAGNSAYAGPASATTYGLPPVLAPIPNQTVNEGSLLIFTNSASAAPLDTPLTDFESYAVGVQVMFQPPRYSGSTAAFLSNAPNSALTTGTLPAGNTSTRALQVSWAFTNTAVNPWLRLTTANAPNLPNPVIDLSRHVRLRIWCDRALRVALGVRETANPPGTPIGSNGGQSGGIEWVGVTNSIGGQPQPTRLINPGSWTTLDFDLPAEPVRNFAGGDGVLSTATGLGVLEHLAFVPAAGNGPYTVYLDEFAVSTPNALTFGLAPGAPTNAAIDPLTGVFTWMPTETQGPGVFNLTVRVTDSQSPPQSDARSFQVTVNEVNQPPVLAPIADRTVHAGMAVTLTNAASDPDWPPNTLTFSLDPGAPGDATIHPGSGVFSWLTTGAQAGGSFPITVRVSDNGTPPLSDTKLFNVHVQPAPTLAQTRIENGNFVLSWSAIAGLTYRVEYKNRLDDPAWTALPPDVTASGPVATKTDPLGPNQRFYRVRVVSP